MGQIFYQIFFSPDSEEVVKASKRLYTGYDLKISIDIYETGINFFIILLGTNEVLDKMKILIESMVKYKIEDRVSI